MKAYTVDLPQHEGALINGTLTYRQIHGIITELGYFTARGFVNSRSIRPYFELQDFVVPCALTAASDKDRQFIMANLDSIMEELSRRNHFDDPGIKPDGESIDYWGSGRLPDHFLTASEYFRRMLQIDRWYDQYKDRYVAIMGENVVDVDDDRGALLSRLYSTSTVGYRPLFTALVTREQDAHVLRPQRRGSRLELGDSGQGR